MKRQTCFWLLLVGVFVVGRGSLSAETQTAARAIAEGKKRLAERDYERSVLNYTEAIQLDPKAVQAYVGRARLH